MKLAGSIVTGSLPWGRPAAGELVGVADGAVLALGLALSEAAADGLAKAEAEVVGTGVDVAAGEPDEVGADDGVGLGGGVPTLG